MNQGIKRVLVDTREFSPGRMTGIGRVLIGLLDALAASDNSIELVFALQHNHLLPTIFNDRMNIKTHIVSPSFWRSEIRLSQLSGRGFSLFISPYPKLPIFGCRCRSVHIIHDVLDLTHPAYKNRAKVHFDTWRLKKALNMSDLTWYDSQWSLDQTRSYAGIVGRNPRVRYPGIDERFAPDRNEKDPSVWKRYGLEQGYILALGNGLPHKNLGVLLEVEVLPPGKVVFVGVSEENRQYWESRSQSKRAKWINYVEDDDLPSIIRGAFCLAQPSTAEGYGYPPLEAMACGIPVVASHIPILSETTGRVALSADPHNARAWQLALERLENDGIYRSQAEKGLKWVHPLIGRRAWAKYISDVYELLTASPNLGAR